MCPGYTQTHRQTHRQGNLMHHFSKVGTKILVKKTYMTLMHKVVHKCPSGGPDRQTDRHKAMLGSRVELYMIINMVSRKTIL